MKRLELFPKIFLYTMSIMLFVVVVTHGLIYLLAPRMQLAVSTPEDVVVSIRQEQFVTEAVEKALPISLSCSLLISVVCSLLFSKAIADPIKKISASTEQMMKLDHGASCPIHTKDEIGALAQNVNDLYSKRRYQMFSQMLLLIRRPGKLCPSIWRGAALWSKTSASLSLTMKSAVCLNRSIVQTSPGAVRAGATAWTFISWTHF